MAQPLTSEEVAKVAALAMLRLSDEELETFTSQLSAILDHAGDVEALDVASVEPTHHPYPLVNVFRSDVVEPFDRRDVVLEMAPAVEGGRFMVPPALGEEP